MTTLADPPGSLEPPSEARPADSGRDYNLAARVYGNGVHTTNGRGIRRRTPASNGSNGARAPYNLAARVYGPRPSIELLDTPEEAGEQRPPLAAAVATAAGAIRPPVNGGGAAALRPALGPEARRARFSFRTFDSLHERGFRWYLFAMLGQFASMQMQMFVRGFLVFELTGSYAALGVISLANAVPGLLLSLMGGVVADRVSKRIVLQAGQSINLVLAVAIAALLYMGQLRFEHLFLAAVVQGVSNAMTMPSRQSLVAEIVGRDRLMNAVSLNTAGMNLTRLLAPGVGGVLVAAVGAAGVYFVMAAMYGFAVVTLTQVPRMTGVARTAEPGRGRGSQGVADLIEGLRYLGRTPILRTILIVNFLIVLVSMPYQMMLPGFVKEVLDGGPSALGLLMSLTGVGSLAGSLVIASLPNRGRGRLLLIGSIVLGVAILAFSLSSVFWLTAVIMVLIGVGQTTRMSLSNVLIQSYVDDAYRGRVMSIYMMEFSLVSFGVFAVGVLSAIIGVQPAIAGTAVALVVISLGAYAFVPKLRNLE